MANGNPNSSKSVKDPLGLTETSRMLRAAKGRAKMADLGRSVGLTGREPQIPSSTKVEQKKPILETNWLSLMKKNVLSDDEMDRSIGGMPSAGFYNWDKPGEYFVREGSGEQTARHEAGHAFTLATPELIGKVKSFAARGLVTDDGGYKNEYDRSILDYPRTYLSGPGGTPGPEYAEAERNDYTMEAIAELASVLPTSEIRPDSTGIWEIFGKAEYDKPSLDQYKTFLNYSVWDFVKRHGITEKMARDSTLKYLKENAARDFKAANDVYNYYNGRLPLW